MIDLEHLLVLSLQWPVKVAVSGTRDLTPIAGPPEGTKQIHLVCWREVPGTLRRCGQTVYVLRLGKKFYQTNLSDIGQGLCNHIAQCHREWTIDVQATASGN